MVFAAYELRVDSLNVMRFNKSVVDGLLSDVPANQPLIVSTVLFRSALPFILKDNSSNSTQIN